MDKNTLKTEKRKVLGRKVKQLRRAGKLPANIYGKKVKSQSVQVNLNDFIKVFSKAGETGLVELVVGSKKLPVLVHNTQKDPVTDNFLHADFLQVDLKQKVTAQVPVELTAVAPAEKQGLGTVVQYLDEIEVEALPTKLPDKFEIDLTTLKEVDDAVNVKSLKTDKDVEIKNDPEQIVVKVEPLRKEEEEVTAPAAEAEEADEEGVAEETESKEKQTLEEKQPSKEESVDKSPGNK